MFNLKKLNRFGRLKIHKNQRNTHNKYNNISNDLKNNIKLSVLFAGLVGISTVPILIYYYKHTTDPNIWINDIKKNIVMKDVIVLMMDLKRYHIIYGKSSIRLISMKLS